MGNVQSGSTLTRTSAALDSFVSELGTDIVYEKSLGSARFLKTVKCRHKNGYVVMKIFIKPDPGLSLRTYHRRLKVEREALADIANVYSYQTFVETEKAGYIIRQWIASNLYDRISTRPFLSTIEKKWIAFQVLNALRDARNRKVSHGDIKSENILVTSWNWVYLSDFASYKPTYLPLDDPADFSFFFDTSGRRTCYIAPERFFTAANNPEISAKKFKLATEDNDGKRDGKVTEAMDCFSVGCVIAELFLEGAPLFTLSQLFKYREREFNVDGHLSAIDDAGVRDMIKQMIDLDPAVRPTFDTLLHTSRGTVFPESFYSFLHNYVSSINDLPALSPFAAQQGSSSAANASSNPPPMTPTTSHAPSMKSTSTGLANGGTDAITDSGILPSDSDHRMDRIWADYESGEPYLANDTSEETVMDVKVDYTTSASTSRPFQDILPVELHIPNREPKLRGAIHSGPRAANEDGPALIILSLVSANLRNCALPSSKVRALDVFLALSCHLTDEAKLDRMVPYIVDLLHDDAAVVRASALRTLMQVLMLVTVITPSNAAIFPEYIIPNVKYLVQDPEVSVRCIYAQCIVQLADTSVRYLEMGQALKAHGTYKLSADVHDYDQGRFEVSYDASLQDLQNSVQEQLSALLMDPSSVVKRAVLHNISSLCIFLGRQKTNDVLLSHMITYLNDRDWLLRYAFFESIVDVAACAGGRSLEEYILPLMIQALSDVEETVVAKVLAALTSLCELGLFQKMRIWELMSATLGFLYHPNVWIRQGAAAFIAAAAKHLPSSDVWCILYPSLRHLLKSDLAVIDEQKLLIAMKGPLSRPVFDAAVQWAMKSDKTSFWKGHRRVGTKAESPRESVISVRRTGSVITRNKSEEDEIQITRLQNLGMTATEEAKLLAMRDYIQKLARAISSFASRVTLEPEAEKNIKTTGDVELQKLGVVPQTVFLKTRPSDLASPRSSRIGSSRRATYDLSGRSPVSGTPRISRVPSVDHSNSGAPFEDLRRRLATINGSTSSLNLAAGGHRSMSPMQPSPSVPLGVAAAALSAPDRPSSPTESVVSTTNSIAIRGAHRLHIGGNESNKAAPAVGSSKTNATGLLEAPSISQVRSDGSPEHSGRTSPFSVTGTIRQPQRRLPALTPISTYDGQEPGVSNLLENLYLDNNRELEQDFGPKVHEGPIRRRNAVRQSFAPRDGTARRSEATLIAHLTSHSDVVTGLAVSPDHMFFVSSSDDKTVKVWDTARLERNVTGKPRHTYGQHHARVKCVCMLEGVHCFASAADDGSLHVVRVHVSQSGALPKYSKLQVIREHRVDHIGEYITCMSHFNTDAASNLIYATTHSAIVVLDLRTSRILQTMENPRHFGPITCMCLDRKRSWIVVGTSTGVLTLWDRRFGLLLKSWRASVRSVGKSARIHQIVVHPTKGRGRWIIVAIETSTPTDSQGSATVIIEVWDIESTLLVETFVTKTASTSSSEPTEEPQPLAGVESEASPAAAIAALVRSRQPGGTAFEGFSKRTSSQGYADGILPPPSPDIRALVVGVDFGGHSGLNRSSMADGGTDPSSPTRSSGRGFMVTGSEDRKIRLWDIGRLERTVVLSGVESENDKPSYSTVRSAGGSASTHIETWQSSAASGSHNNRPPQRMSLITHNQQNLLKSHQDVITAMLCIDSPFRGGIVSGDRTGAIKVWRVDGGDH
ncbi:hypothetical protein PLICRDRAFT_51832 [Plicaturopsis crispa FD-325 SS-3]|nr:hypothetical protein PLICRDRAFT_51832 [Plicaturopsis crispa FD-325 SS-3]